MSRRGKALGRLPIFLTLAALGGCGAPSPSATTDAGAPTFGATALSTTSSDSGALSLELRTSPQPPIRGTNDAELTILDPSGAPVDGLLISLVPWMPAMGHGTSVQPEVSSQGAGHYLIRRLFLIMPGEWELRLSFTGARTDHAIIDVAIP